MYKLVFVSGFRFCFIHRVTTLYGYVSNTNIEYEWKSEPGACEICQGMDGTIYDSANNIPDRPHPNCKCWIDVQEEEPDEPISDPLEARRDSWKDEKRAKLNIDELLGRISSMKEDITGFIQKVSNEISKLSDFEQFSKLKNLGENLKSEISKAKEELDFSKYKGETLQGETDKLEDEALVLQEKIEMRAEAIEDSQQEIKRLEAEQRTIGQRIDDLAVSIANKERANKAAPIIAKWIKSPNAYELYAVGSPGYKNNPKYVQKNGELHNSIGELQNTNLERDIKARVKAETGKEDCKVLSLKNESSLANSIKSSPELSNFLKSNPSLLKPNGSVQQGKITFEKNPDLYNSLHGAVVKDARTDAHGNLTLTVQDLWNFNAGRTSVRGRIGEKLQNEGFLENYYIIIDIKIPKEDLKKYNIK